MPYAEYAEWKQFYECEPFGLAVQDLSQAHLASIIANVNRNPKTRPKPYRMAEFMIFEESESIESKPVLLADPDAQTELLISAMFGGLPVIRADQ